MHRHELDEATDKFVGDLQAKLPPYLSSFGPATPERIRDVSRSHVEAILAEGARPLETVGPLVADLLRLFSVAPAETTEVPEAPTPETPNPKR